MTKISKISEFPIKNRIIDIEISRKKYRDIFLQYRKYRIFRIYRHLLVYILIICIIFSKLYRYFTLFPIFPDVFPIFTKNVENIGNPDKISKYRYRNFQEKISRYFFIISKISICIRYFRYLSIFRIYRYLLYMY